MELTLPAFIASAMRDKSIDRKRLVSLMSYRNETKGLRRVDDWLAGRDRPRMHQVALLAEALGVDKKEISKRTKKDIEALEEEDRRLRAQDPNYYINHRWITVRNLGPDISEERAIEELEKFGKEGQLACNLAMPGGKVATYDPGSGKIRICE